MAEPQPSDPDPLVQEGRKPPRPPPARQRHDRLQASTRSTNSHLPTGLGPKPKPVLVASGQQSFSAAGTATIKIKLTATGKRRLKHSKQLKLTAKGTFTPTGETPVSAVKAFVLER